jgi:hypothetical protein
LQPFQSLFASLALANHRTLIELVNFPRMLLLLDQSGTGSKSARDIAEMRLLQVVTQSLTKLQGALVVITCEKEEQM